MTAERAESVIRFGNVSRLLQRQKSCEHLSLFVCHGRIGKPSPEDRQFLSVDELFHRSHERLPVPA